MTDSDLSAPGLNGAQGMGILSLPRAAGLAAFIMLADQLSKWWVVELVIKPLALPPREDASAEPFLSWVLHGGLKMPFARVEIFPFFNLVMVWNKGISFGFFNQAGAVGPALLSLFALAVMGFFTIWLVRSRSTMLRVALAMIIGGAAGNILDRARFGAVADFLDFHISSLHWPAFNVGDSAICLGIAMLLVHSLFFEAKHKAAAEK